VPSSNGPNSADLFADGLGEFIDFAAAAILALAFVRES
jgi:hypothetical protein